MSFSVSVENIKCNGCATSIRNKLAEHEGVRAVEVDVAEGRVSIDADEASRNDLVAALAHMGYPEVGSVEGFKAATSKAKSFVSCAVGRIDNMTHG
ncbi:MAG: heavy-metal-associated domain-containing protein [Gammaproteobacteria bacterium SHHR-1]|uniref:heavy-metal-associated domain-containing protein n=1 Tax=Magnetovirga frankeli TaxID=947516 RepID=UPI0012935378|nr:heavy-metal-associated domain-containing protein [gamma proteobacterium SS-5]